MITTTKQREDLLTWLAGVPVDYYEKVLGDFNELETEVETLRQKLTTERASWVKACAELVLANERAERAEKVCKALAEETEHKVLVWQHTRTAIALKNWKADR